MIQFNEPVSAAKVRDGFYKGDGKRKHFSVSAGGGSFLTASACE